MKAFRPDARVSPVQEKVAAARRELSSALIERDQEVDLVLTALLAREHVLLVGPPGCAKSLLLEAVMRWLGGRTFTCLLTRSPPPRSCSARCRSPASRRTGTAGSRRASCRRPTGASSTRCSRAPPPS